VVTPVFPGSYMTHEYYEDSSQSNRATDTCLW